MSAGQRKHGSDGRVAGGFAPSQGHGALAANPRSSLAANAARAGGFTLMEMLVTLMLISMATMLMFQMLGSYRIANERVREQAGTIDRSALFHAWFRESVQGLYAAPRLRFVGSRDRFSATTLNPLYAPAGRPTAIEWLLRDAAGGIPEVVYFEDGVERWSLPLKDAQAASFAYYAEDWRATGEWPPRLGKIEEEALPALVGLVREGADGERPILAAVLGPLAPPLRLYGEEQYE